MSIGAVILWGLLATIILTATEAIARGMGWTRMSIPFLLGSMFTLNRDRADLYGLLAHAAAGLIFAFLYAVIFEFLGQSSWWLGLIMGLVHAIFVLSVILPLMPSIHPHMADETHGPTPTRMLQPAGFMAKHYGRRTAIVAILAHMLYGAFLGALYQPHRTEGMAPVWTMAPLSRSWMAEVSPAAQPRRSPSSHPGRSERPGPAA